MPLFRYQFAAGALDRLTGHHVAWQMVLYVLTRGHPSVREHVGAAVLRVTAADRHGDLLMVTLLETGEDDLYEILSARYLNAEESAAASYLLTPREDNRWPS